MQERGMAGGPFFRVVFAIIPLARWHVSFSHSIMMAVVYALLLTLLFADELPEPLRVYTLVEGLYQSAGEEQVRVTHTNAGDGPHWYEIEIKRLAGLPLVFYFDGSSESIAYEPIRPPQMQPDERFELVSLHSDEIGTRFLWDRGGFSAAWHETVKMTVASSGLLVSLQVHLRAARFHTPRGVMLTAFKHDVDKFVCESLLLKSG